MRRRCRSGPHSAALGAVGNDSNAATSRSANWRYAPSKTVLNICTSGARAGLTCFEDDMGVIKTN